MNAPSSFIVRLVSALAVNAVLFGAVSLLHGLFGGAGDGREEDASSRRVVMEVVRPKEEEPKPQPRRIRQVETASAKLDGASAEVRFTPDLGLAEGGGGVSLAAPNLEAMVFEEGATDEDIVPLRMPPIPYPERAKELGIQGTLEVVIVIGRDGSVESIEIVASPHPSITAAARAMIATWRFKPATNKGIPVRVRARKAIEFRFDER